MGEFRLIEADCVAAMADMDEASVDAIVTDPPYGLEFMGKEWDRLGAGVGQVAEGMDVSHPFRDGTNRVRYGASAATMQAWHEAWATQALRVLKPGGHLLAFGGTRTIHRLICALEDAGFEIRDMLCWLYGSGFPKSLNLDGEWKGWGTALKPAWEGVTLARKPLIGSVAQNVLAHGTGALNIDGTRIESTGPDTTSRPNVAGVTYEPGDTAANFGVSGAPMLNASGRWPPNVILDGEAASMLDEQTGERANSRSGSPQREMTSRGYEGGGLGQRRAEDHALVDLGKPGYPDTGGASRFFHVIAAEESDLTRFRYIPKTDREERNRGLSGERSSHPTVKPVALMQWLVRLITPPGGTILDPFTGSGSTGMAALREGFDFIGIERESEYVELARARIVGDGPLFNVDASEV